jgi:hypothetical protein
VAFVCPLRPAEEIISGEKDSLPMRLLHLNALMVVSWLFVSRPYITEKTTVWFHDIFYEDGTPYRQREVEITRAFTRR